MQSFYFQKCDQNYQHVGRSLANRENFNCAVRKKEIPTATSISRSPNQFTFMDVETFDNNNSNNNRDFVMRRIQKRTAAHNNIRVHTLG
jgi:NMD protein affecting ribosome stability and mRNA decay